MQQLQPRTRTGASDSRETAVWEGVAVNLVSLMGHMVLRALPRAEICLRGRENPEGTADLENLRSSS